MLLHLVPALLLLARSPASGLCSLGQPGSARCSDLGDARYMDTYHLHHLAAPLASSRLLVPGNFANLTGLRHLDLSGGAIERIEAGSFAELRSLQSLDLSGNGLRHLDAGAFDGLEQLHSLRLGDNALERLPAALAGLERLRLLDASSNPLVCDCATLRLRDALLVRGVKISRKTQCSRAPISKPDTELTCALDLEMQADQGSGESSGATEASGEEEEQEEGSGLEDDHFDPSSMPGINYEVAEDEETASSSAAAAATTTTTEKAGLLSYLGLDFFSNLNPFVSTETTTSTATPPTTETSFEEAVKSEEFLPVSTAREVDEPREKQPPPPQSKDAAAESQEETAKQGMGSYIVLASLLAILAGLIAIAAYKGDFCRKKRKRADAERATEMKDMRKPANGSSLENVPLMKSSAPPGEPRQSQRSYDVNEPVKPPRKGEIEAPLNGLNPPMEDIDAPAGAELGERPERLRITLQENPDSVPRTPMLITRLQEDSL